MELNALAEAPAARANRQQRHDGAVVRMLDPGGETQWERRLAPARTAEDGDLSAP